MTKLENTPRGYPPFAFSTEDAASYIGVSERHVRYMVEQGRLPTVGFGRRRLIRRVDLERFLDAQADEGYIFRAPQTIREAIVADAECKRLADAMAKRARRTRDPEDADWLLLATRAYTQLAACYRRDAGLEEFAPEPITERISA